MTKRTKLMMKYVVTLLYLTPVVVNSVNLRDTSCFAAATSNTGDLVIKAFVEPDMYSNKWLWFDTEYEISNYSDGPPVNVTSFSHLQGFQFSLMAWGRLGMGIRIRARFDSGVDLTDAYNQTDQISEQFRQIFGLDTVNETIDCGNSSSAQQVIVTLDKGYFMDSIETITGMIQYGNKAATGIISRDYLMVYSQYSQGWRVGDLVSLQYDATIYQGNLAWEFSVVCNKPYHIGHVELSLNRDLLNHTGPISLPVSLLIYSYSGVVIESISPHPQSSSTDSGITTMNWPEPPLDDLMMSLNTNSQGNINYNASIIIATILLAIVALAAVIMKKKKRKVQRR